MKIGYARVSTEEQNLDLQLDALTKAGCEKIYQEKVSGMKTYRVELSKLLAHLRAGDVLVIWKLDRLGRSLQHLVELTHELLEKEIGLQSLSDPIDTTTAQGRLVFNIFASLAQFERDLIRERTMAGLASARARGRLGGRKKGLSAKAQKTALIAEALYKQKQLPVMDLCKQLSISKPTLYRYLRSRGVEIR
ncbi:recombinase family protein [Rhodocytophaga aerolata]|uniref:Recombinase family protein n=1 Tax=Rhodocytophaga aerolata TaxID=455078 RepID=A0ABT8RJ40_9BACT|nr:recombinase family protein [Rhodocytophaga aerolata]MDO1450865.1 recombinase family protein [Rhodocytophaga aerolata]